MLTIRNEQMKSLDDTMQAEYHRRLLRFYRATVPEATARYDDDTLLQQIADGHRRAGMYGIHSREGIVRFVGLGIMTTPHFDDDPAVKRFLLSPELDPDFKIQVLSDLTAKKLREDAEQA
jgi:hypothetical protein